tara:strand:+ start:1411 stop:1971 length:561 start_codon:yes stop_codon:yes gene_type:complete
MSIFDDRETRLAVKARKATEKGKATRAENLRARAQFGTKNPQKIAQMMLLEEARKFREDPASAGLSETERQKMLAETTQAAQTGAQAVQSTLARSAMTGQQMAPGALQEAARTAGGQAAQARATASQRARELSNQMIRQKGQQVYAALAGAPAVVDPMEAAGQQAAQTMVTDVAPQIMGDLAYGLA